MTDLLAIFAHPDDETFRCGGTLALLSARGASVQVVAATRGEGGACGDPPLCAREELGALRESELRCACAALGIAPPLVWDYADGTLADEDHDAATERLVALIREVRPAALLTWPPSGLSGHPDHRAVSHWTTEACALAIREGAASLAALYHLAVPSSVAKALGFRGLHAVPDDEIDVAVAVSAVWDAKMAAIACHRTQHGETPILRAPEDRRRLFLGVEHFARPWSRTGRDPLAAL